MKSTRFHVKSGGFRKTNLIARNGNAYVYNNWLALCSYLVFTSISICIHLMITQQFHLLKEHFNCAGMMKVILKMTPEHSGRFWNYRGDELPW